MQICTCLGQDEGGRSPHRASANSSGATTFPRRTARTLNVIRSVWLERVPHPLLTVVAPEGRSLPQLRSVNPRQPSVKGVHTRPIPVGPVSIRAGAIVTTGNQTGGNAMAVHTDTLTIPTEGWQTPAPPEVEPPTNGGRALLGMVAVALAGLASWARLRHLHRWRRERHPGPGFYPEAEQIEREAHLEGQARTYLGDQSDIPAQGFYPEAEQIEREAHLEGQARTYLGDQSTPPAADAVEDSSDTGFLPGSRHVPTS